MKIKDVKGIVMTSNSFDIATVTVRVTRDEKGCTLSLAQEDMGIQLSVAFESIADMLGVGHGA